LAPIHGLDTRPTSLLRILAGKTAGKNQVPTNYNYTCFSYTHKLADPTAPPFFLHIDSTTHRLKDSKAQRLKGSKTYRLKDSMPPLLASQSKTR